MNFDEIFFHSRNSNKDETLEMLKTAILNEYLQDLCASKGPKFPPTTISFLDITSWVYHKTYAASSPEAKTLWCLICSPKNEDSKEEMPFEDFFRKYAELLYDKHQKVTNLRQKHQKISKLMKRAVALLENLDGLFKETSLNKSSHENPGNTGRFCEEGFKFSFTIHVDSLENFDMTNIFKDKDKGDYLGHHIELGYTKEKVLFTQPMATNGRIVNFRKTPLTLALEYMTGSIFINVYEDFLRETKIEKLLIASRNLDVFSNVSRAFLLRILMKEVRDEGVVSRFKECFEEIEKEEEAAGHFGKDGGRLRLLKSEVKTGEDKNTSNLSHNCSIEMIENNVKSERFKLLKTNSGVVSNPYVILRLYITCDNLKDGQDLIQYKEMMELRKEFLVKKSDSTLKKIGWYKVALGNLIVPLRSVVLTENEIRVDRKFLKKAGMNAEMRESLRKERSCSIF